MNQLIEQAQRMSRRDLGAWGEKCAETYLRANDYRILDRNWRGCGGELDIVAYDPQREAVVAVEGKTRRACTLGIVSTGTPEEAIIPVKLARLRSLIGQWCMSVGAARLQAEVKNIAVDVVGVVVHADQYSVNHVKDVQ